MVTRTPQIVKYFEITSSLNQNISTITIILIF